MGSWRVHIPLNTRFCAPFVKELYRCWSAIYGQHCIAMTKVNIQVVFPYVVKKLNGGNFIKVTEGFRCVIININFLFHLSLDLFIGIYYDKSSPFKNLSITSMKSSPFNIQQHALQKTRHLLTCLLFTLFCHVTVY